MPRFRAPAPPGGAPPGTGAAASAAASAAGAGPDPSLETTAPAVPLPPPAKPAKKTGKSAPWALIGGVAGLAVIGALIGVWYTRRTPPPPPVVAPAAPVLAANQRPEYLAALADGQQKLLAGDYAGATSAFTEAERLAPGDEAAASLRAEAERQQVQRAEVVPPAEAEVEKVKPAAPPRVAAAPAPVVPAPAIPAPVEPSEPAANVPAGRAQLSIDFHTELSPGTLTVYLGGDQILREPFRFTRRSGLRTTSVPGGWTATRAVMPGDNAMRVIVSLDGRPTKVINLQGNFREGTARSLVVRIDAKGGSIATLN